MVDGTALLMAPFYGASAMGFWSDERGTNLLDSGAPYYDVYRCADGLELGVAAIEPQFFAALLEVLDLDPSRAARPERPRPLAGAAAGDRARRSPARPRAEWLARAEGTDACVAPVLTMREAARAPARPRARHDRRARRRAPARAGAAVLGHARRARPRPVRARPAHRRGPRRGRASPRRDQRRP